MNTKNIKNNKNILLLSISTIFLFVMLINFSSAAIAMINPVQGANLSANFVTNWSFVNITDGVTSISSVNSTFYWNGTGSWVAVTKSNFICNANSCNATLDITSMGDGHGVLNFTAGNTTLRNGGTVSGLFTVDQTVPTLSISTDKTSTTQKLPILLTWSATDSISGVQTTSVAVTAVGDAGCSIPTTTYSTATGTSTELSGSTTQCAGPYTATLTSTNYAGLSDSTTSTFNIYYTSGGSGTAGGNSNNNNQNSATDVDNGLIKDIFTGVISMFRDLFSIISNLFHK